MITTFRIKIAHIIIAILVVLLFLKGCGNEADCVTVAKETTVEEKTITTVDKASIPVKNRVPEKVSVIETPERIELINNVKELSRKAGKTVKEVNRYLDTTKFKNAVIYSNIIAEGRILQFDMMAAIDHKETIITNKETHAKIVGGFFISPGIDYSPLYGLESVETSLTWIKGSFGGSLGAYYNFGSPSPSIGTKIIIHIKL